MTKGLELVDLWGPLQPKPFCDLETDLIAAYREQLVDVTGFLRSLTCVQFGVQW